MGSRRRYSEAHAQLSTAQKPRRGQIYSVLVNRPIGRRFAALAYVAGLTPNQVTLVSTVFTAAGIALLAAGPTVTPTGFAVAVLLLIGYALDSADGQLARLRGGGSIAGEWLDHMIDSAKVVAVHLAVAVFLHRSGDLDHPWLLVPLGYAVVAVVSFFAMLLNDLLLRSSAGARPGPQESQSVLYMLVTGPRDFGILCLVFALVGWPVAFMAVYGAFFAYNVLILVPASVKWFREMSELDRV